MTDDDKSDVIDWLSELTTNVGWISQVIYARVRDRHAVEDVIQELGASVATWPRTVCGAQAVNRWLYNVAVKQALFYRRTRYREQEKTRRYAERASGDDHICDPLSRLIASENAQSLHEAIDRLTSRQREVLLLKHFEDWSCRQIAEKFGLAESTVQRHLVDARKRLRLELMKRETKHEG